MGASKDLSALHGREIATILTIALVVAGAGSFTGIAQDDEVSVSSTVDSGSPYGIHLSITKDASSTMTVTWFTQDNSDAGSVAQYASSCTDLSSSDTREQVEGSSSPLTLAPNTLVHSVTMTGFEAGEEFAYRVGEPGDFSQCYNTHTAPENGPIDVAMYGDQGLSSAAHGVHDLVAKGNPDLVLIAGDLSYAEGDPEEWDEWFEMNEDIFARAPMMATPGNHETYASTDPATLPLEERLTQPDEEIYFSFDYGNIHVLGIHTSFGDAAGQGMLDDQLLFAEEDLRQAKEAKDAGEIDHIFVLQHHPIYSNALKVDRRVEAEIAAYEEHLFHRYDVNMLLAGHNHHYERSYPMAYGVPTSTEEDRYEDPIGWIQVISGNAGRGLYKFIHRDDHMPHRATFAKVHGYTNLEVDGEVVDVTAIQAGINPGNVVDEFTLVDTDERVKPPTSADEARELVAGQT